MAKITEHFHRLQVTRAQVFIRESIGDKITLEQIARKAGASPYHFVRVFSAYTGETPFQCFTREKILSSLKRIINYNSSFTTIAFECGFESSSAFNKAFKKHLNLSPSEFRNLDEAQKSSLIYNLSMGPKIKEIKMNFTMELKPEIITREEISIFTLTEHGEDFKIVAPKVWSMFLPLLASIKDDLSSSEFYGVGTMDKSSTSPICHYGAGFSMPNNPQFKHKDLVRQVIPRMKYARFILKGSHENVWIAFEKAFQMVTQCDLELADSPCLENYINDPSITPVDELITEILIPLK